MFSVASLYEAALENISLRRALKNNEFELFYQPVVRLEDNQIIGAEALVRWRQSDENLLYPKDFLPGLRRLGLMRELDAWVLTRVTSMGLKAQIYEKLLGLKEFHVFVNIDANQLQNESYAGEIMSHLKQSSLAANKLVIEISECGVYDTEKVARNLRALSEMGVIIALDDFGTGHSNLNQIRELPLHILKLDKSFIDNIFENSIYQDLLFQILDISKTFNLNLLVEGVETKELHDFISSIGVHSAQGFYYSQALPEVTFWNWVEKYQVVTR